MKKNLLFMFLMVFVLMGISSISAITYGTNPTITVNSIAYFDRFGNVVDTPYYNGDKISVVIDVNDLQGYSDIKYARIYFNDDKYVDCSWSTVINNTDREFKCIFMVPPNMEGTYQSSIKVEDRSGLTSEVSIGNFYFNPTLDLTYDNILFNPENPVMGQTSETGWLKVRVDSPTTNNPYFVTLYGNNLYEDTSNCQSVTTYTNKTTRTCKLVNHKTTCTTTTVQVPKTSLKCPPHRNICGNSNTMYLKNFKYQIYGDDGVWKDMSYSGLTILNGVGSQEFYIKFKVDVPNVCYGNYILDGRNIKIVTRI